MQYMLINQHVKALTSTNSVPYLDQLYLFYRTENCKKKSFKTAAEVLQTARNNFAIQSSLC